MSNSEKAEQEEFLVGEVERDGELEGDWPEMHGAYQDQNGEWQV